MRERTFTCPDCGISVTVPVKTGRPQILCGDCVYRRKLDKAKADRAAVRVAHEVCQREGCSNPLPAAARADAKWCSRACQSWNNRRASGQVVENLGTCSACLKPLTGRYANAKVCLSAMCRGWAQRHPGVPHPSTQPRTCKQCGESIDHLNARAKFCSKACTSRWLAEQDREAHNAKARAWQASEKGKSYKDAYRKANMERYRRLQREARQRDPQRYSSYWKQWAEGNPEALAEVKRLRRARKLGNPDSIGVSVRDLRRLLNRSGGYCAYCGQKADEIHIDHVVPLAKGGRHALGNLAVSCKQCNVRKHAMFLSVWRYRRRRRSLSA